MHCAHRKRRRAESSRSHPQLACELAFLSGLRHMNITRFYGAYTSASKSEAKLVMELCEGRSFAAIGEQIRRRKGRRLGRGGVFLFPCVCCSGLTFDYLALSSRGATAAVMARSCRISHICTPRSSFTATSNFLTSCSRYRM